MNHISVSIHKLEYDNFNAFLSLLKLRGEAPIDYYKWKYLATTTIALPRGFLAKVDNQFVGCIGIVPRLYSDQNNLTFPATWFADWFIIEEARGKGIGKALISEVASITPHGFGIPGTIPAQKLAAQVGYISTNKYNDHFYPINPIRYGWTRGGGSIVNKFKRVFYYSFSFYKQQIGKKNKTIKLTYGFPDPDSWINKVESYLKNSPHLVRTNEYLNWLKVMPLHKQRQAHWWHFLEEDYGALGIIQQDNWGLRRCRIIDSYGKVFQNPLVFLNILSNSMKEAKIDYLVVFGRNSQNVKSPNISPVPLFYLLDNPGLIVTGIDRENWWRDLRL